MKTANRMEPWVEKIHPGVRHALWKLAVKSSRTFGRLTARYRVLPDYLIVGTQRGGTTTLQKHLTQHPRVASARLSKGVHYFDVNYGRGEMWYRSHFHTGSGRRTVAGEYPTLTGEASPYYIFHPDAARRIAETLPEVRLILLIRDPVERAFSQYRHEVARGFEPLSFEDALNAEPERLEGEEERLLEDPGYLSFSHQHHSYLARGDYRTQLDRFLEHFRRDQIFIAESSELFQDPGPLYSRLLEFLGLEPFTLTEFEHLNPAPRQSAMDPATRQRLERHFQEPDVRLTELIGHAPSWLEMSTRQDSEH